MRLCEVTVVLESMMKSWNAIRSHQQQALKIQMVEAGERPPDILKAMSGVRLTKGQKQNMAASLEFLVLSLRRGIL